MFDDDHAVADASLALVGMLSECLGLEELAQEFIEVRPFPERRVAALVHAMVAGALHRRHRCAAGRSGLGRARAQGDGAFDARDLPPSLTNGTQTVIA